MWYGFFGTAPAENKTMQLEIAVPLLAYRDLAESPPAGVSLDAPVEYRDGSALVAFTLFVLPVATGVVADWLYDKLKKHDAKTIRIERHEVVFDQGEIKRIIREKIEIRE